MRFSLEAINEIYDKHYDKLDEDGKIILHAKVSSWLEFYGLTRKNNYQTKSNNEMKLIILNILNKIRSGVCGSSVEDICIYLQTCIKGYENID